MALKGRTVRVQGRVIWAVGGNLFKGKSVLNKQTKQQEFDKKGNARVQRGFGLAVDKRLLQIPANLAPGGVCEFWNAIHEEAYTLYPDRMVPKNFAWKKIDGDVDTNEKGEPWNRKEGYSGCIVLPCTTELNIPFYMFPPGSSKPELIDTGIKVGDYVDVQLNIVAHPPENGGKPGLYLNPLAVCFLAPGQAIITQPDGEDIFGNAPAAIPQFANVVHNQMPDHSQQAQAPVHNYAQAPQQGYAPPAPSQQPQYQQPPAGPGQPYQQPAYAPPAPQGPVDPHYGVVPQHLHPQQPAAAPMPPGIPGIPQVPR